MKVFVYCIVFCGLFGCVAKYTDDRFEYKKMKGAKVIVCEDAEHVDRHFGPDPLDKVEEENKQEDKGNWWIW